MLSKSLFINSSTPTCNEGRKTKGVANDTYCSTAFSYVCLNFRCVHHTQKWHMMRHASTPTCILAIKSARHRGLQMTVSYNCMMIWLLNRRHVRYMQQWHMMRFASTSSCILAMKAAKQRGLRMTCVFQLYFHMPFQTLDTYTIRNNGTWWGMPGRNIHREARFWPVPNWHLNANQAVQHGKCGSDVYNVIDCEGVRKAEASAPQVCALWWAVYVLERWRQCVPGVRIVMGCVGVRKARKACPRCVQYNRLIRCKIGEASVPQMCAMY